MKAAHPRVGRLQRTLMSLQKHADSPWFVWWVAGTSLLLTLVAGPPFGLVLSSAVLLRPQKWLSIALLSAVAATIGSVILLEVFHHLGWHYISANFPEFEGSDFYQMVKGWLAQYGVWTLFLVTIIPMPQTPALALCALVEPAILPAAFAILLGKGIRYSIYAGITAWMPGRVRAWYEQTAHIDLLHADTPHADHALSSVDQEKPHSSDK